MIKLDGVSYSVGGAELSAIGRAYLNRTEVTNNLEPAKGGSFMFAGFEVKNITAR